MSKPQSMKVTVEFFGIPRARAGVAETESRGATLGEVLLDLATRFPNLGDSCIEGRSLREGFLASIGGDRFVTDPETKLNDGDSVLFLSLDAGG